MRALAALLVLAAGANAATQSIISLYGAPPESGYHFPQESSGLKGVFEGPVTFAVPDQNEIKVYNFGNPRPGLKSIFEHDVAKGVFDMLLAHPSPVLLFLSAAKSMHIPVLNLPIRYMNSSNNFVPSLETTYNDLPMPLVFLWSATDEALKNQVELGQFVVSTHPDKIAIYRDFSAMHHGVQVLRDQSFPGGRIPLLRHVQSIPGPALWFPLLRNVHLEQPSGSEPLAPAPDVWFPLLRKVQEQQPSESELLIHHSAPAPAVWFPLLRNVQSIPGPAVWFPLLRNVHPEQPSGSEPLAPAPEVWFPLLRKVQEQQLSESEPLIHHSAHTPAIWFPLRKKREQPLAESEPLIHPSTHTPAVWFPLRKKREVICKHFPHCAIG